MGATLATVGAILKEVYEPQLQKQLNDETVALKRVEKSSDGIETHVGGKYVSFPIHTRRNSGIGARNEGELLPTPGQQGYNGARVGLKYLYGGIQLTGQTIELADTNYQAFVSVLDKEVSGLKDDVAKDQNRQVYGDGTGVLATITADGVNTVTVADGMYLLEDMMVDILAADLVTVRAANRQLTNVDPDAGTATYSGADASATIVAGDVIVRTGNANREWTGFKKIVNSTGSLFNIDPATEKVWRATVDANGGVNRALSEGLLILNADRLRAKGTYPTVMFSNLGVRRAYFNLLSQQRQYTGTKEFAGGFTGLTFTTDKGDIPFVVDTDCPKNTIYGINEKEITWYREGDWSWMDRDGSMWQRVVGYDAYEARLYQYSEIGVHRRNAHFVIKDVTEG